MDNSGASVAGAIVGIVLYLVILGGAYVWLSLALGAMFKKAGEPAWAGWVPVYNVMVIAKMGGLPPLLGLLSLAGLGSVVVAVSSLKINQNFRQPSWYVALALLVTPVWASILGWGKAQWAGPAGSLGYAPAEGAGFTGQPSRAVGDEVDDLFGLQPARQDPAWGQPAGTDRFAAPASPSSHNAWEPQQGGAAHGGWPAGSDGSLTDSWIPVAPAADRKPDAWSSTSQAATPGVDAWNPTPAPAADAWNPAASTPQAPAQDTWRQQPGAAPDAWAPAAADAAAGAGDWPQAAGAAPSAWAPAPGTAAPASAPNSWSPTQASATPQQPGAWDGQPAQAAPSADVWSPAARRSSDSWQPAPAEPAQAPGDAWSQAPAAPAADAWSQTPAAPAADAWSQAPAAPAAPASDAWSPAATPAPAPTAPTRTARAWDAVPEAAAADSWSNAAATPESQNPSVAAPAWPPAGQSADRGVRAGEVRMRDDSEVVAQARAAMNVPAAEPAPAVDDGHVSPIVVPGPSGVLPGAAPQPASAPEPQNRDPWQPAMRREAPIADTGFDMSAEVSAVAGAPDAGAPRSAMSSISAQHPNAGVPDEGEQFDATEIAVRHRPSWTLVTPTGSEVQLTSNVVILGRKPSSERADIGAQLVPVPDGTRTVSKTHARLEQRDGTWFVTDLGSTNGVVLIGPGGEEHEAAPNAPVAVTERFLLGDAELRITSNSRP